MKPISITLNLGKIDKNRIVTRKYTNKEGVEVTIKEYKLDVVEVDARYRKTIKEGDTWIMQKSHIVRDSASKEERQAKTKMNVIGEGITFQDKQGGISVNELKQAVNVSAQNAKTIEYPEAPPDDIAF